MAYRGTPRRPEGIRWLRSDGKPNFSTRLYRREGELKILATRPVIHVAPTTPFGEALETMAKHNVRALPVAQPSDKALAGLLKLSNIVSYLGGGELYNIVVNRYGGSIYKAMEEPVDSIMDRHPFTATIMDRLTGVLERMVLEGVGVVVVVDSEGRLYGILTEHDIVRRLMEKKVGVRVSEVMARNVVTIDVEASLMDAAKRMIKYRFRRLPAVDPAGDVKGMLTAKDIVRFFGTHQAYIHVTRGLVEEAMSVPVYEVMSPVFYTVPPDMDVGDAATLMAEKGVSSLLVVKGGRLKGIITERDVLFALAANKPS